MSTPRRIWKITPQREGVYWVWKYPNKTQTRKQEISLERIGIREK
jgi:hypothetical protein